MDVFVCMIRWYWGYQTVYLCIIHPKQNDTIHFSKQLFFHKNFASVSLEFVQSIGQILHQIFLTCTVYHN